MAEREQKCHCVFVPSCPVVTARFLTLSRADGISLFYLLFSSVYYFLIASHYSLLFFTGNYEIVMISWDTGEFVTSRDVRPCHMHLPASQGSDVSTEKAVSHSEE